jgi:ATP-dependent exoDNAse (exonuclease V) alpha subunit
MNDFKVGDKVIVLNTADYAKECIGEILTVCVNPNNGKICAFHEEFEHYFRDDDGADWITCGVRNFISTDIRKLTKLELALK